MGKDTLAIEFRQFFAVNENLNKKFKQAAIPPYFLHTCQRTIAERKFSPRVFPDNDVKTVSTSGKGKLLKQKPQSVCYIITYAV